MNSGQEIDHAYQEERLLALLQRTETASHLTPDARSRNGNPSRLGSREVLSNGARPPTFARPRLNL
jgi:hypothetical protein